MLLSLTMANHYHLITIIASIITSGGDAGRSNTPHCRHNAHTPNPGIHPSRAVSTAKLGVWSIWGPPKGPNSQSREIGD